MLPCEGGGGGRALHAWGGSYPLPLGDPRAGSGRRGTGLPWGCQVPGVWLSVLGEETWGGGGGLSEGVGNREKLGGKQQKEGFSNRARCSSGQGDSDGGDNTSPLPSRPLEQPGKLRHTPGSTAGSQPQHPHGHTGGLKVTCASPQPTDRIGYTIPCPGGEHKPVPHNTPLHPPTHTRHPKHPTAPSPVGGGDLAFPCPSPGSLQESTAGAAAYLGRAVGAAGGLGGGSMGRARCVALRSAPAGQQHRARPRERAQPAASCRQGNRGWSRCLKGCKNHPGRMWTPPQPRHAHALASGFLGTRKGRCLLCLVCTPGAIGCSAPTCHRTVMCSGTAPGAQRVLGCGRWHTAARCAWVSGPIDAAGLQRGLE